MACVSKRKSPVTKKLLGFTVQFYDHRGIKRKVYSFVKESTAITFGENVDELVQYVRNNEQPCLEIRKWLATLSNSLHGKLAQWGLVEARPKTMTLAEFVRVFTDGEQSKGLKPSTISGRRVLGKSIIDYFGPDRDITTIKDEDAMHFFNKRKEGRAAATWGHDIRIMKLMFNHAVRVGWIEKSPFANIRGAASVNVARQVFVKNETITRLLSCCASSQERLILCLGRYGGLRLPSELIFMEWSDIDFEHNQFIVKTPKKEKQQNQERGVFTDKAVRVVPMFPELRKAFMEYYEDFPEGGPPRLFSKSTELPKHLRINLDRDIIIKRFQRLLAKAGVPQWCKFFQNMRSTRETELHNMGYPLKDVCAIIGNTPTVAMTHYLQNSSDLMAKAATLVTNPEVAGVGTKMGTKSKVKS